MKWSPTKGLRSQLYYIDIINGSYKSKINVTAHDLCLKMIKNQNSCVFNKIQVFIKLINMNAAKGIHLWKIWFKIISIDKLNDWSWYFYYYWLHQNMLHPVKCVYFLVHFMQMLRSFRKFDFFIYKPFGYHRTTSTWQFMFWSPYNWFWGDSIEALIFIGF